jgi:hypothetical protein
LILVDPHGAPLAVTVLAMGVTMMAYRKRCMDLVSFETQQEYDWVKGFINGKNQTIIRDHRKKGKMSP